MKIELTPEEKKLIIKRREEEAFDTKKYESGNVIISLAAQWGEWSLSSGYGLTFSTFCDEFCVEERVPEEFLHPKVLYEGIKVVIDSTDEMSTRLARLAQNQPDKLIWG